MRHHGIIREDRRGLAAIVGLLGGIIVGSVLLAGPAEKAETGEPRTRPPALVNGR